MSNKAKLGDRSFFPKLQSKAYLNHAAISPPSYFVQKAIEGIIQDFSEVGIDAFPKWIEQQERLRLKLAKLINSSPVEIGFVQNTTTGVSQVAQCMKWKKNDRILLFNGEFPANITPWQMAAVENNLEIKFIDLFPSSPEKFLESVEKELKKGVRILAISAVQFQTGWAVPLKSLGNLCKKHGSLFFVDAIQACGVVPIDVKKMGIDFLSCGGHKWLMGLNGLGFLYINQDKIDFLNRITAGWLSHKGALKFLFEGEGHLNYQRPIRKEANFIESGSANHVASAAMEAAIDPIITLGVENIHRHVNEYIDRLESGLTPLGFKSLREKNGLSGILSLICPQNTSAVELVSGLQKRKISVSMPDGKFRCAPHWPNSAEEIDEVIYEIRQLLG